MHTKSTTYTDVHVFKSVHAHTFIYIHSQILLFIVKWAA